jgi:SAM-dependent methyltransferase
MTADEYDAWYRTPRGAWIGQTEYRLLRRLLAARPGETLIDVGCGTGYFTRRFARDGLAVTGVDPDVQVLRFARALVTAGDTYVQGDARRLPFRDGAFDLCVSVAALCFIRDEALAIAEILRVTRRRFAIGLLNRHSLLYLRKGRRGGRGAYRGAHWHTPAEARALFARTAAADIALASGVFVASGGRCARLIERWLPERLPLGAFLVVAGSVRDASDAPTVQDRWSRAA